ncbi:hypothetical protein KQH62_01680 [bacterium]|nr:hypothetical protein [bacterium]
MAIQNNLVLGTFAAQGYEVQTLILVSSLRRFGGRFANIPVWVYVPENRPLSGPAWEALQDLGAEMVPFLINDEFQRFPFAAKTLAAAVAEERAEKEGSLLAWHDRTGLIRNAPEVFDLPEGIAAAFRPTDIANIGAPYGEPLPEFWQLILEQFNLTPDDLPPITTAIDSRELYLYVNAGLLVVRPEKHLLQTWAANLQKTYTLPKYKPFYQQNQAYAIFMHQAALTAAMAQKTQPEERLILPNSYLFSIDNFYDYPDVVRPNSLDEIVTGRFHDFFALPDWESKVIASPELIEWFKEQLAYGPYWPKVAA